MGHYYVNPNPQPNGDYEVHLQGCYWLSLILARCIWAGSHRAPQPLSRLSAEGIAPPMGATTAPETAILAERHALAE